MKKLGKVLGGVSAAALVAGLIPYRFKSDKETGAFEVGGLLWSLKKVPGEEKDDYTFELLPGMGSSEQPAEAPVEEAEVPVEKTEEPAAEEATEEIVEE